MSYNRAMPQEVEAIYENGVLRPLGKLGLCERERVKLSVSRQGDELASLLDHEFVQSFERYARDTPSLELVRQGLSRIRRRCVVDFFERREVLWL
jgi:predicted DNA-binding antitoxin AbrB/MazE fold protein